jgi:mannose-1-phosphate guanylyltransferase
MTAAMVLCAGLGTRLRPLTSDLPKALMPVGDRPALAHILGSRAAAGLRRVVVNAHHRADDLAAWARTEEARDATLGGQIVLVREREILGTAGGVAHAKRELGAGDVLVHNGDILVPGLDPEGVLRAFCASGAELLWLVAPRPAGQGTVGLGEDGRVVRLRGRAFGQERSGADFLGIQVIGEAARRDLPAQGCLVGEFVLPLLARGTRIATLSFGGAWHDIGDPGSLLGANLAWLERRGVASWSAPDASVAAGVRLDRSLVGPGARVSGSGTLARTVVFPGGHVAAPAENRIVSASAAVVATAVS